MRLYHGTSGRIAEAVLKLGLKPRIVTGASNWKHSVESNLQCVYLTDVYAPFFAQHATKEGEEEAAIIEVETDRLQENNQWPDEDFLEQATRTKDREIAAPISMEERTKQYKLLQPANRRLWARGYTSPGDYPRCVLSMEDE